MWMPRTGLEFRGHRAPSPSLCQPAPRTTLSNAPQSRLRPQGTPWPAEKHGNGQGSWTLSWTRNPMPRTEARWQQTPIRGQRPDPTQRDRLFISGTGVFRSLLPQHWLIRFYQKL